VLAWYRDSKRDYITWQVEQMQALAPDKKVIIYVPGTAYTQENWDEAIRTGRGNDNIMIMTDTKFLVDLAARKKCMLQYTGMPLDSELHNIRTYIDSKKYDVEMWGENAGMLQFASDPEGLVRSIIKYKLFGLDYTHGYFLFKDKSFEPSENMTRLQKAFELMDNR
jgi:hypothetical protein